MSLLYHICFFIQFSMYNFAGSPALVGLSGLEPPTSRLSGVRSNRLSYKPIFFFKFGGHLLSHTVTSAVPSAALVLTIVFGMGTGVSPKRIATSSSYPVLETAKSIPFRYSLITKQQNTSSTGLLSSCLRTH